MRKSTFFYRVEWLIYAILVLVLWWFHLVDFWLVTGIGGIAAGRWLEWWGTQEVFRGS